MSRIKVKNLPKLKLSDLLRRRKTTLNIFLKEFGITTYESLFERCDRMGVEAPSMDEFLSVNQPIVNNPAEGVVVLEAPPVIKESTGKEIIEEVLDPEPTELFKKKQKKKKDSNSGEVDE